MTLWCWTCHKSVTNELPAHTVFRGIAYCPECIEAGKDSDPSKYDHDIILTHTRELEDALAEVPRLIAERDRTQKVLDLERQARQMREDELKEELDELRTELGAAREEALSWVREVTGRDCDIARLTAERDAALERGRQLAYVEMREERERMQHDLDAALALLKNMRQVVQIADAPEDVIEDWLAQIDALLEKTP